MLTLNPLLSLETKFSNILDLFPRKKNPKTVNFQSQFCRKTAVFKKRSLFAEKEGRGRGRGKTFQGIQSNYGGGDIPCLSPNDLELLYPIGQLSLQKLKFSGQPFLPGKNKNVDSDTETQKNNRPAMPSVKVYAARVLEGELAGERVVLKEYLFSAQELAKNELQVYSRLLETSLWYGANEKEDPPILSLLGYFTTQTLPSDPSDSENMGADGQSTWLMFRWEALRAASFFAQSEQKDGILSILNPFKTVFPHRRARFIKEVIKGGLKAVTYCHARGVVHGAVSLSCLILNTFDERDADSLRVKLASFGLGNDLSLGIENLDENTIDTCRQFGASSPLQISAILRQLDLYYLGLALLELVFSSLAKEGPSERFSMGGVQALWEGVFQLDVGAIKDFCGEDEEWEQVVTFLNEGDGGGWELFEKLLKFQGFEADELLRSDWLVEDGVRETK